MLHWSLGILLLDLVRNGTVWQQMGVVLILKKCDRNSYSGMTISYKQYPKVLSASPSTLTQMVNRHMGGQSKDGKTQ